MTDPLLNVRSLRVCYGQSEVIGSLSLSASKGEILAVMGLNGMGKTTLMKALIGLLSPRAGTVSLDGTDITGAEPYQRVARGLAYVPQGRMVFATLTVEENIQTGLRPSERDVPPEIYGFFPVLEEMRRRRAGTGESTARAASRRADRGDPALHHQGARRAAQGHPRPGGPHDRALGAG